MASDAVAGNEFQTGVVSSRKEAVFVGIFDFD